MKKSNLVANLAKFAPESGERSSRRSDGPSFGPHGLSTLLVKDCSCSVAAHVAANQAMILIMIENLEMRNPGLAAEIRDDLLIIASDPYESDRSRKAYASAARVLQETVEFRTPLRGTW